MIIFGVRNMPSDDYRSVNLLGMKVIQLVINIPEQKRERTKDLETRLQALNERRGTADGTGKWKSRLPSR